MRIDEGVLENAKVGNVIEGEFNVLEFLTQSQYEELLEQVSLPNSFLCNLIIKQEATNMFTSNIVLVLKSSTTNQGTEFKGMDNLKEDLNLIGIENIKDKELEMYKKALENIREYLSQ